MLVAFVGLVADMVVSSGWMVISFCSAVFVGPLSAYYRVLKVDDSLYGVCFPWLLDCKLLYSHILRGALRVFLLLMISILSFLHYHCLCIIAELHRETSARGVLVSLWVCPGSKAHIAEPIEFGEAYIENAHGARRRAGA